MNVVTSIFGFSGAAKWADPNKVATAAMAVWLMIIGLMSCFFAVGVSQVNAQGPTTTEVLVQPLRSDQDLPEIYRSLSRRIEIELAELRALESQLECHGQAKMQVQDRTALAESVQVLEGQLAEVQNLKQRIRDTLKIEDADNSPSEHPTGVLNKAEESPVSLIGKPPATAKAPNSGAAKAVGADLQSGLLLRLRLDCGCMGEIHLHDEPSGQRYRLHHRHRNGKMTTRTIGRVTGGVPANWNLKATLPGGSGIYQDSKGNFWTGP